MPGESLSGPLRRMLGEVLDALASAGARAAVAGGIAQQVWGRIRATRDLDLLVLSVAGEKPVLDALARGLRATRKPKSIAAMTLHSFVRDDPEGFVDVPVDLFFVTSGLGPEAVERAVSLPVGERAIPVVRAEDLLLLELLADRVLDRADAQDIVREQGTRLFNARGELRLPVRLDWGLKPGCVAITNGFWISEGGAVNLLSQGRETDMGFGAAFHDNAVQVEKA